MTRVTNHVTTYNPLFIGFVEDFSQFVTNVTKFSVNPPNIISDKKRYTQ